MRKAKPKVKRVTVRERKLGREQAHGMISKLDTDNPLLEIDERLRGFKHLTVLCHEAVHASFPSMAERRVISAGKVIAGILWASNYRRFQV